MVRKSALSWFRRVFQAAGHEIILVDFNQDFFKIIIYSFGCTGSFLLHVGFLELQ